MRGAFEAWLSLGVIISWLLLAGCATAGGSAGNAAPGSSSSGDSSKQAEATIVGTAISEAELKPVGDSSTRGTAVFQVVGSTDVQVELSISGLPTNAPDALYYAQVHEGSCSEERSGEEHDGHGAGAGPALAFVKLDRLLTTGSILGKDTGEQAHGGDEPGIPKEPPGSIEQPVSFGASDDGTASVSSLLEGVAPERLRSGAPEYVHLHAVRSEGAPEELACGDLIGASRQGSG